VSTLRLSRFLARAGAASRRGAADLVAAGRVRINGRPPVGPGDPVDPERDTVTLDGRRLAIAPRLHLALHKPVGYVTSRVPLPKWPTVFDLVPEAPSALVTVGRLDVMTSGLLLFTTDGDLAARLMHPSYAVPRTYRVEVTGALTPAARRALDAGVTVAGSEAPARALSWAWQPLPRGGALTLVLAEGRKRVVRRMCKALGFGVRTLVRTAYGPVALGRLSEGAVRPLSPKEVLAMYRAVRLAPPDDLT
jgi:23S rRNA pseudouridine2605 synthase